LKVYYTNTTVKKFFFKKKNMFNINSPSPFFTFEVGYLYLKVNLSLIVMLLTLLMGALCTVTSVPNYTLLEILTYAACSVLPPLSSSENTDASGSVLGAASPSPSSSASPLPDGVPSPSPSTSTSTSPLPDRTLDSEQATSPASAQVPDDSRTRA
jgi:hypothetical protein